MDHAPVHRAADVGHHALADPADQVEAQARERRKHERGQQQEQEVAIDGGRVGGAEALVDDVLQRLRQRQHGAGGDEQREQREDHAPAVGRKVRQQCAERF